MQRHLNSSSTQIILKNASTFTQNNARFWAQLDRNLLCQGCKYFPKT